MSKILWPAVTALYKNVSESGDARGNQFPLVITPLPAFAIMTVYVTFVRFGPRYFKEKPPMAIKPILMVYNVAMVLTSSYMFHEFTMSAYLSGYSVTCQPLDHSLSYPAMRMVHVCWWFYMSKMIELFDTVFLIVRKKERQLSFLHVFHHATMVFNQWTVIKYIPSGHAFFQAWINSFIHIFMYFYYFLACFPNLKKYLWWKKYLTMMQMAQFVFIIGHVLVGLYYRCDYPHWPAYLAMGYCSILIVLFSNYFIQTYCKIKPVSESEKKVK